MTYAHTYSGTRTREPSPRELEHGRLARRAAAGGIVLLKNTGTLPLDLSAPVALFGSGASRTVKGGIGSGDVNNRANVSSGAPPDQRELAGGLRSPLPCGPRRLEAEGAGGGPLGGKPL